MFSIISGFDVSKMGQNLPAIWFGSTLKTVGTGLLIMLTCTSSMCILSLSEFTMLNGPKCRTGSLSSGPSRSDRCRLFIPYSGSDIPSSDAIEGHGYCNGLLRVPSVSNYFFFCHLTE